ncbi:MAG TPA: TadE family protein [Candidatus Limnocylindrales bacterium]
MTASAGERGHSSGQTLVEFALVLIPFVFLLMGIFDLGRGIYVNNGVAQAAREIARTTSVHTGSPLGQSSETQATIATQKNLVPGLADPSAKVTVVCTDVYDVVTSTTTCGPGDFVRVTVSVPFRVLTLAIGMSKPMTLGSTAHVEVP